MALKLILEWARNAGEPFTAVETGPNFLHGPRADPWNGRFAEVIHFELDDRSEVWSYLHWRGGQLVRYLGYRGDAGWADPVGDREPWEDALFFGPEAIARAEEFLADCRSGYDDAAAYDAYARQVRERLLERRYGGDSAPAFVFGLDVLAAVKAHHRLPG